MHTQPTRLEQVRAALEAAEAKRNDALRRAAETAAALDRARADEDAAMRSGDADAALAARQRADELRVQHDALSVAGRRATGAVELARRQLRDVDFRIADLQRHRRNIALDVGDVERQQADAAGRLEHCRARLDQLARSDADALAELARLGAEAVSDG